jgi:uncharacterized protein YbjT (DUF2867 family)
MPRTALIAGASGLVGGHCLHELLNDAEYDRVLAIVRKPLRLSNPKLTEIPGDADHIPELPPLFGAAAFCAIGTTIHKAGSQAAFRKVDADYTLAIAKAALAAGAIDFVLVSSVDAAASSSNFYLRVKGEVEGALTSMPFRSVHILQPSLLLGERQESRPAERAAIMLAPALKFLLIGGLDKYRPIAASDVGRAMARCLRTGTPGRQVYRWREIMQLSADRRET